MPLDFPAIENIQAARNRTNVAVVEAPMILLEQAAAVQSRNEVARLVEAIDWASYPAEQLLRAIDLTLGLEMAGLAINLAQLGGHLFPRHERIQRAAQVLAPPIVRGRRPARVRGLSESMSWLRQHAGQYRGQWVAVRACTLLGAAATLEELQAMVGQSAEAADVLVTRVL